MLSAWPLVARLKSFYVVPYHTAQVDTQTRHLRFATLQLSDCEDHVMQFRFVVHGRNLAFRSNLVSWVSKQRTTTSHQDAGLVMMD